jgi:hypothetical protein
MERKMRTLLARLAFLVAAASLAGCDTRAIAKPNPRINTWQHVVNVLVPNEAVVDITNDGGSGWVRVSVAQDGRDVGSTRAYFTAGQQQVVRLRLASTVWKLRVVTDLRCQAAAE